MFFWKTYLWTAIALLCLPTSGRAQGPQAASHLSNPDDVEVIVARAERVSGNPGTAISVGFEVHNRLGYSIEFSSRVLGPMGWSFITTESAFHVGPNDYALRLVSVGIPVGCAPGDYRVSFIATSADGDFEDRATLYVEVATHRGLEISTGEAPRIASAARPHNVEFVVHNSGNTPATALLSVRSSLFAASLDEEVITITANGRYSVNVRVEPDPDLQSHSRSRVRLQGSLVEDSTITSESNADVSVIPDGTRRHALRPRVELYSRVSSAGDLENQGVQAEVASRIPLSGDSLHHAEVLLRTPSTARTAHSQSDTYALAYTGPSFRAKVGDHVFDLSPLTSIGRYGTGVGAGATLGRFDVKAFMLGRRHDITRDREGGGSVGFDLEQLGRISVLGLASGGINPGYAGSLRHESRFGDALSLDIEGGLSGKNSIDPIYSLGARGRVNETAYYAKALRRSEEHPGQNSSYASQIVGLSSYLRDGMAVSLTASNESSSRSGDDYFQRDRLFVSGALIGEARHQNIVASGRLELRAESYAYSFSKGRTEARLVGIRLRAGVAFKRFRVSGSIDVDKLSNQFNEDGVRARVELESSWNRSSHRVQASVVRETGPSIQFLHPSTYTSFRLSGEEQLTDRLKLKANVMGTLTDVPIRTFAGTGWSGVEYQFEDGKRLSAEIQMVSYGGVSSNNQASYRLTLDLPLSVSNPFPIHSALVEGMVLDETTGVGIPDVLIFLGGQSTLTGPDGRFALRKPEAGIHHLIVDRVTLGLDRVPSVSIPMLISVPAQGRVEFIRIPVSSRGQINGNVLLYDVRGGAGSVPTDTVAVGAAQPVIIEIASGDLRYRRMSNPDGSFSFSDLPPNEWLVRVLDASLPEGFRSERPSYTVTLPSTERIAIRLLSESRPHHLLDGGEIGEARSDRILQLQRD